MVIRHTSIFGPYKKGQRDFDDFARAYMEGEEVTDNWGCVWHNLRSGMRGQVKVHPLADWKALSTFKAPDPLTQSELGQQPPWDQVERETEKNRAEGKMIWGRADRFFERLHFLRGYKNLMMDLIKSPPEFYRLIEIVEEHDTKLIKKWLEVGVDGIRWGDDLGTQMREMMSPATFRRQLFPSYARMVELARNAGCEAYLHSDGHILKLLSDLMDAGFTVINPQISCNDIDQLAKICKGKVCLDADIDRQHTLPRGTPEKVRNHIEKIVLGLGSKEGGLTMIAGIYADVPLENIEALCQAMEDFQYYYS